MRDIKTLPGFLKNKKFQDLLLLKKKKKKVNMEYAKTIPIFFVLQSRIAGLVIKQDGV